MSPEEIFAELGFNTLEAEVYVGLLKHGAQTAYKIGKLIGRPTANVYKAVDVLSREGAIEVMEGDVRVCKALPIETVVKQLETAYKRKTGNAIDALNKIKEAKSEEGIYTLQTADSVFQRVKEMIARAEQIIVLDAFPGTLQQVLPVLNEAAKRGLEVFVQAYSATEMDKRIAVVIPDQATDALQYWEAQQINIVVDGKEMLVALFNKDLSVLVQANYSNNLYLSCMMHSGIISEHKVHKFEQAKTLEELGKMVADQKNFLNTKVPGLELLFKQYKREG